jgi:transposase
LIPAAGVNQRATIFGALEYRTGQVTSQIVPKASSAAFATFVEAVVSQWQDAPVVLVLDNASYHKNADLRHWFADHAAAVDVLWLPTYSPKLNLLERVWRFLKARLACHRFWHDQPGLIAFAQTILDRIRARFGAGDDGAPHLTLCQDL